jgi:putative ABC transport system permease protein
MNQNNPQQQPFPPQWAIDFLQWYCKNDLLEEIEGDLLEEYRLRAARVKKWQADLHFIIMVFSFLRLFAIKKIKISTQNNRIMYANYLKVAYRNIRKDKANSIISVFGLILAFTASMLIYRIVQHEINYDTFHENSRNIYRVILEANRWDSWQSYPTVGPPLGPAIKEFYPEIKEAVRFRYTPTQIMSTPDGKKQFYEEKIFYTDPSVFEVFTYPFLYGDPSTALQKNTDIVITEKMARKYFGKENALGRTLLLDNEIPYNITGVLAPVPASTHFKFDFLLPFDAFKVPPGYPVTLDDFGWTSFHTYVMLEDNVDPNSLSDLFPDFARTHFDEERIKRLKYGLQPLQEIYFGDIKHENISSGSRSYILILASVGVLLTFLAAFNFTNLSLARSVSRAKETGLRKTLGSSKKALIVRYLSEPILIVLSSVLISLNLVPILLPYLNTNFDLQIHWELKQWIEYGVIFGALGLLIGILSGLYPALIMSRYNPITIIRGSIHNIKSGAGLKKALVTLQYAITSFLIIGSFIIASQINFLQSQSLGFEKDEILLIRMPGDELNAKYRTIKNVFGSNARVKSVSVGGGRMDGENGNVPIMAEGMDEAKNMAIDAVREDFYETIGTPIVTGREFSFQHPSDSVDGIIINREAVNYFNWTPEEAIGRKITVGDITEGHIIGVVENFHNTSLHNKISPLVIYYPRTLLQDIYVRVTPGNVTSLISDLEKDWNRVVPGIPFDFVFMSQHLQKLYNKDIRFAKLVKVFTFLTILISVLGLYGLVTLVSENRIKEISLRKIFGAPFSQLILTLSKSFIILILIANVIAWPFSLWMANYWMQEFAYHTEIQWEVFVAALFITMAVSGITLFVQSRKVAVLNPAKTLKYD